jgi:hypothetical protein
MKQAAQRTEGIEQALDLLQDQALARFGLLASCNAQDDTPHLMQVAGAVDRSDRQAVRPTDRQRERA